MRSFMLILCISLMCQVTHGFTMSNGCISPKVYGKAAINRVPIRIVPAHRASICRTALKMTTAIPTIESTMEFNEKEYIWNGHSIKYASVGSGEKGNIVLVHGFGASFKQYRSNIPGLAAAGYKVLALDLLGFGRSEKAPEVTYSIELWAALVTDFIREVAKGPAVVVGNSIGSLVAVTAAANPAAAGLVGGLVLLNCAGGMNSKLLLRSEGFSPVAKAALVVAFWLVDRILETEALARPVFDRFRSQENVRQVLQQVYINKERVDDDLVRSISEPAEDPNALPVFVKILTGEPGVGPISQWPAVTAPTLVLWGDRDPWTPDNGDVGRFFKGEAAAGRVDLQMLEGVGHCPHDDAPDRVNQAILDWLKARPAWA